MSSNEFIIDLWGAQALDDLAADGLGDLANTIEKGEYFRAPVVLEGIGKGVICCFETFHSEFRDINEFAVYASEIAERLYSMEGYEC